MGFGHLRRCLAIAAEAKRKSWRCVLVVDRSGSDQARDIVARHGYAVKIAAGDDDVLGGVDGDMLILDIAHPHLKTDRLRDTLAKSAPRLRSTAFIDALAPYSMANFCDGIVDFVVVPYLGPQPSVHTPTKLLAGPQWAAFDETYNNVARARDEPRQNASRVLVTFGGADPTCITLKALEAIRLVTGPTLDVKIVIGPFFAPELVTAVKSHIQEITSHRTVLITAPETLASEMRWCDVAIAATGLTKYELALTGTPSLQISLDARHEAMNAAFAEAGTARHLGVDDELTPTDIATALGQLLVNAAARRAMAKAGRRLIDGRGAERLLDALHGNRGDARTSV